MSSLRFIDLALLIFILSITLVLPSSVSVPKSCKAALAMPAAALSDIPIWSAFEAVDGILIRI